MTTDVEKTLPQHPRVDPSRDKILAILAESGFSPAQGTEAMLDRLFPMVPAR